MPIEYGQFYSGTAFPYSNPFKLYLCNDLTQSQVEQVRQSVKNTWLQLRADLRECNCFEVHVVSVDKYTDSNSQVNTQVSYIGKAGREIIETTTSSGYLPTTMQMFAGLQRIGFTQCMARSRRSVSLLGMAVASPSLARTDYDLLQQTVQRSLFAVRPDFVTNNNNVSVKIVSNRDALDLNTKSAVTQVYLQVMLDNKLVDFYTQTEFDTKHLIEQLNYENENNTLKVLNSSQIYARNYFFTILSGTRVRRADYPLLEQNILDIFVENHAEYREKNVSVAVTWQEEYIDENKNLVHGLSILISVDNQPINNLLTLDKNIFFKLRAIKINGNEVYSLRLPSSSNEYLHSLSKALTFYSNILVCRRDYFKIEKLLHDIVADHLLKFSTELTVILAHQDELIHKNG